MRHKVSLTVEQTGGMLISSPSSQHASTQEASPPHSLPAPLFGTVPEACFLSVPLMHNLLTYTIPVNGGLRLLHFSEIQDSIKIWIYIKGHCRQRAAGCSLSLFVYLSVCLFVVSTLKRDKNHHLSRRLSFVEGVVTMKTHLD